MCNKVVTNGCNGACCAAVFFPYTVEELKRIRDAKEEQTSWIDAKGIERVNIYPKDSVVGYDHLIDMIVELGWQTVDPETGRTFKEKTLSNPDWEGVVPTNENLQAGLRLREDGEIEGNIITCKHFDTELKICKDYENRPGLCRSYGATCKYKGCNCAELMKSQNEEICKR